MPPTHRLRYKSAQGNRRCVLGSITLFVSCVCACVVQKMEKKNEKTDFPLLLLSFHPCFCEPHLRLHGKSHMMCAIQLYVPNTNKEQVQKLSWLCPANVVVVVQCLRNGRKDTLAGCRRLVWLRCHREQNITTT